MIQYFETINLIMACLSLALIVSASVLVVDLKTSRAFKKFIQQFGLLIAFFLTLGGMLSSLVYSEIYGFVPCGLCWIQRIFLYAQVFILGTALYWREKTAPLYGIVLSGIGTIVALYQHYLQIGGTELIKCPISAGNCADRFFFEFDFLTFPLMSAFTFIFLIVLYTYLLKTKTN